MKRKEKGQAADEEPELVWVQANYLMQASVSGIGILIDGTLAHQGWRDETRR